MPINYRCATPNGLVTQVVSMVLNLINYLTMLNKKFSAVEVLTLALVAGLSCQSACAQALPATASLHTIIETFYQRLETTYPYQPVSLPSGVQAVRRYLRVKNKEYLLEYIVQDANQQMQESFFFKQINKDTLIVSKEKYLFGSQNINNKNIYSNEVFTKYLDELRVEAGSLLIRQRFDPLAGLGTATGVALYATDIHYETLGDTIACYIVQVPAPAKAAYRIDLRERRRSAQRRWNTNQLSQTWLVDATTKNVSSTRIINAAGSTLTWVRTYKNATDFSETLVSSSTSPGAGVIALNLLYKREFRQQNAHQGVDAYSVPDPMAREKSVVFEITSNYK